MEKEQQKKAGRPPENIIEPIDDTPENVAKAVTTSIES